MGANMKMTIVTGIVSIGLVINVASAAEKNKHKDQLQYLLVNLIPYHGFAQHKPESFNAEYIETIKEAIPEVEGSNIRVGVGFIFSYFRPGGDAALTASLKRFLALAEQTDTPVFIQLDGENWWEGRPDLWNWWDPSKPGFNPANRYNVEWTDWTPDSAIKIAWRNWGRQIRVLPPPNLMSPVYQKECKKQIRLLVPVVMKWYRKLPTDKKDLFVGIKVGHESSIGVNAWYYPNGNDLLNKPADDDPTTGLKVENVLDRGVTQIGYAAVKTARIRKKGKITEKDLVEVVQRHLQEQSREVRRLGVPRDKLFTHAAGWKDGELLYGAAVNKYSCPGWSFYKHAGDPRKDEGVQRELKRSSAPCWAAVEWLYMNFNNTKLFRQALENTLSDPRCKFLCIYNWEGIKDKKPVLEAIRNVASSGISQTCTGQPKSN